MKLKPLFLGLLVVGFTSCTDLEIEETDSRFGSQSGEFTGIDATGVLNDVYNAIRGQVENQADLYALAEVSTDEFIVPTRGTDWGDNGLWRQLHSHTWNANQQFLLATWNNMNRNVFNASAIMDSKSEPTDQEVAEAKFLRAYSMFWVVDLFGQAPFRDVNSDNDELPIVYNRTEATDFIIKDLEEAIAVLPDAPVGGSTKATAEAAKFLLAKVLLNRHVYNGSGTPDSGDMNRVITLVNEIEAAGFELHTGDYFELFTDASDSETIWFTTSSVGNQIWNGLHYKQNSPDNEGGGWNGFSTIAEFYDLFEGDPQINVPGSGQEERRGFVPTDGSNLGIGYGFLIGQQYDQNGDPLTDRPGNPLVFTKELPGLIGNDERNGIRVIKYHPENGAFAGHKILFRFADAYLMRAEAEWYLGGDITADINVLRDIRGASPLPSVGAQELLDERGRELYAEFWRRNDLIRFGQFTAPWSYKEVDGDETKNLYPIPAVAISSNPNLTQNPGY